MYILLWEDIHADADIYAFKEFDDAYRFAMDRCEDVYEENGYAVDYTLDDVMKSVDWLFFANVSDHMTMRIEEIHFTG